MISCRDADVLAAALSVGSIDTADELKLQRHLADCADCRRLAGEYMAAASRLPLALEPLQPSKELRARLMKAVYAESAADDQRAESADRISWWRQAWSRVPVNRGFTVLAAAAGAAVIGFGSWIVGGRQGSTPASRTIAVTGMQAAPHASGQLILERTDNEAVLTATGLPGPAQVAGGSAVYEVWLIRADHTAVAAAFLSQAPDGSWSAAMHGDMSAYSTVAATVEPAGGSVAPTGPEVLQAGLTGA